MTTQQNNSTSGQRINIHDATIRTATVEDQKDSQEREYRREVNAARARNEIAPPHPIHNPEA